MEADIMRRYQLQGAHHLPKVPEGHKCGRVHGHTWDVEIHLSGTVDPEKGWFADFAEVDEAYGTAVHDVIDHRDLNDYLDNPTTENLCWWIMEQMLDTPVGKHMRGVVAQENDRGSVAVWM